MSITSQNHSRYVIENVQDVRGGPEMVQEQLSSLLIKICPGKFSLFLPKIFFIISKNCATRSRRCEHQNDETKAGPINITERRQEQINGNQNKLLS